MGHPPPDHAQRLSPASLASSYSVPGPDWDLPGWWTGAALPIAEPDMQRAVVVETQLIERVVGSGAAEVGYLPPPLPGDRHRNGLLLSRDDVEGKLDRGSDWLEFLLEGDLGDCELGEAYAETPLPPAQLTDIAAESRQCRDGAGGRGRSVAQPVVEVGDELQPLPKCI